MFIQIRLIFFTLYAVPDLTIILRPKIIFYFKIHLFIALCTILITCHYEIKLLTNNGSDMSSIKSYNPFFVLSVYQSIEAIYQKV